MQEGTPLPKKFAKPIPRVFELVTVFNGYRNREDVTNLTPGIMVHGSFNVVTTLASRLSVRKGYTQFGQKYTDLLGVKGVYDLLDVPYSTPERHLKTWGTNIELLWEGFDDSSAPLWKNIWNTAPSPYWNFTNFWDGDNQRQFIIGVDGGNFIWTWNTAIAGFLSSTANTLTKQGTTTWEQEGFDIPVSYAVAGLTFNASTTTTRATIVDALAGFVTAGFKPFQRITISGTASNNGTFTIVSVTSDTITVGRTDVLVNEVVGGVATITFLPQFTLNGVTHTYTGGTSTTTLTGVNSLSVGVTGDLVYQTPQTYLLTLMYGMTFTTVLTDSVSASQLYLASKSSNQVFFSKTNNFLDYEFSANARLASEGGKVNFDAPVKALVEQDGDVYGSAGKNEWGKIVFNQQAVVISGISLTTESVNIQKIKTANLTGAISQAAVIPIRNNFAYLSFSKQALLLGKTQFQDAVQTSFYTNDVSTDLSYPVYYDFQEFDQTDASVFYDPNNEFLMYSFPAEGVVMIYNQSGTNQTQFWESPQLLTVGRFATIHGETYFHGNNTPTSYKLFDGLNDDGHAIFARAKFSYMMYGKRANKKKTNSMWAEGYIRSNTKLAMTTKFEQPGCGANYTKIIDGSDLQITCPNLELNPIGMWQQGAQGLGSVQPPDTGNQNLPPAFQVEKTFIPTNFLKQQFVFESNGIDQAWELVAFGGLIAMSDADNVEIKE